MEAWTDAEVLHWLRMANDDLEAVAREKPNSRWHEACFAAAVTIAQEAGRRGLKLEAR